MSTFKAAAAGFRLGLGHLGLALAVWLLNLLVALPASLLVADALRDSMGHSLVADNMRQGFDMAWFGEFAESARGLESSFDPGLTGAGAVFQNLDGWVTGAMFRANPAALGLAALWALLWLFLLGGVLARYDRVDETFGPTRFVREGGRYFFRFLRLALLSAPLYGLVYILFRTLYEWLAEFTRDVTEEGTVLFYSLCVVALIAFLLVLIHLCFAYAKIATVVDERRSAVLAALRGLGFVLRYPARTLGLFLLMMLVAASVTALYAVVAPGAGQTTPSAVALAFLVGQVYLFARLIVQLSLLGGQLALYREVAGKTRRRAPAGQPT